VLAASARTPVWERPGARVAVWGGAFYYQEMGFLHEGFRPAATWTPTPGAVAGVAFEGGSERVRFDASLPVLGFEHAFNSDVLSPGSVGTFLDLWRIADAGVSVRLGPRQRHVARVGWPTASYTYDGDRLWLRAQGGLLVWGSLEVGARL
jgi:hypothetical protein